MSFDLTAAVERIQRENAEYIASTAARRSLAQSEGRRLAELIQRSDPEVRRVLGFGSTFVDSGSFTPDSDIDLALEGGDITLAQTLTAQSSFSVDVVSLEGRQDPFVRMILENGVELATNQHTHEGQE